MNSVDPRTLRAISQYMSVLEEATDLYLVVSESGKAYTVDLAEPACTCPDFQYREVECKHIRRVKLTAGITDTAELRATLESNAKNLEADADQLVDHVESLRETAAEIRKAHQRLDAFDEEGPWYGVSSNR